MLADPDARARLLSMNSAGRNAGSLLTALFAPLIVDWLGWAALFWLIAALSFAWLPLWFKHVATLPNADATKTSAQNQAVPWARLTSDHSVQAVFIAHIANNVGFYLSLTFLPTLFQEFGVDSARRRAVFGMAPWATMLCVSLASPAIADSLRARGVSLIRSRRLFTLLATLVPCVCFVAASSFPMPTILNVALVSVGLGFVAFAPVGFHAVFTDVAPEWAGDLFSLSNMLATLPGIFVPSFAGSVLEQYGTVKPVFVMAGFAWAIGGLIFVWRYTGELIRATVKIAEI